MSKAVLSKVDHRKAEADDMRYLVQPRGPGKSWVFRMKTPPDLVDVPNPWDGKPLGKEIKKGLGTRHPVEARRLRDIALGDVRRLEDGLGDGSAFSLASAVEWREAIREARQEAEANGEPFNVGAELVLHDKLEAAEGRGVPRDQLKRFARVATPSATVPAIATVATNGANPGKTLTSRRNTLLAPFLNSSLPRRRSTGSGRINLTRIFRFWAAAESRQTLCFEPMGMASKKLCSSWMGNPLADAYQ